MTVGRTLWVIIIIKLIVFFGVLKLFFFPDLLERDYATDGERAEAVRSQMIDRSGRDADMENQLNNFTQYE